MSKKKRSALLKAEDERTWKLIRYSAILGCPVCGPNSGCNKRYKERYRSWKKHRKTQYK